MLKREVENLRRRLVLGRRHRVSGEFLDLWILCYPDDAECKATVEGVLDRMVESVSQQGAG